MPEQQLGTNGAVEYGTASLTSSRDILLGLWNAATNDPPKANKQRVVPSRREREKLSDEKEKKKWIKVLKKSPTSPPQRKVAVELLKMIRNLTNSLEGASEETKSQFFADLAVMIFQVRDIRGVGKGARPASWSLFRHFAEMCPESGVALLEFYPTFGYWKDLLEICRSMQSDVKKTHINVRNKCYELFARQLHDDFKVASADIKANISLAGKWAPRRRKMFDSMFKASEWIAAKLYALDFPDKEPSVTLAATKEPGGKFHSVICSYEAIRHYDSVCSFLNQKLATPEIKMCQRKYEEIELGKIAGKCLNRNKKIFTRLIPEQMQALLEKAEKTGKSVKGTSLFLPELINNLSKVAHSENVDDIRLIELQWRDHEVAIKKYAAENNVQLGKGLVLADVSGSMHGDPMNLSISMAIFVSSLADSPWTNLFITFESDPVLFDLSECTSLLEKYMKTAQSPWGGSTDVLKAFDLVLKRAMMDRLQPEDLPEWIMVVSDMQFDSAVSGMRMDADAESAIPYSEPLKTAMRSHSKENKQGWKTHHEILKLAFEKAGNDTIGRPYPLPLMIYWNARGDRGMPVLSNTEGALMISGYSSNLVKLLFKDGGFDNMPTPFDGMRDALDHPSYAPIRTKLNNVREAPYFANYSFTPPPPQPIKEAKKEDAGSAVAQDEPESKLKRVDVVVN